MMMRKQMQSSVPPLGDVIIRYQYYQYYHILALCLDSRRGNLFLHRLLHATLSTLASQDMLTHTNHQRWLRTTAKLLLYRDPRSFCHYTYTVFDACPGDKVPTPPGWMGQLSTMLCVVCSSVGFHGHVGGMQVCR